MNNIMLVIITALISGLLATLITIIWQNVRERRNRKLSIFATLMAYRFMVTTEESVKALNSIDVVFYKDRAVCNAYKDFVSETEKSPELNPNTADKHLKLLEEMAKSLNLKYIEWDSIKHYYYPAGLAKKLEEETVLRNLQIQSAISQLDKNEEKQNTTSERQFSDQMIAQILPDLFKNPDSLKMIIEYSEKNNKKKQ